jgi:hypothetical protein
MYQFISRNGILVVVSLLVACGGGGDGGSGSSSVTATAVLAEEDPLLVTQEVFASSSFAQSFALGFVVGADGGGFSASAAAPAGNADANEALASYAASLVGEMADAGEGDGPSVFTPSVVESCSQGGFVDVSETPIGTDSARLELTFTACEGYSDSGLDLPGIVTGRMAITVSNASIFGADFSINLDSLAAVDGDDSVFIDGKFDGTVTFDSGVTYIDIEMSTDSFYASENGVESELINYSFNTRLTDSSIREGFSGGLAGSGFDGIISFETLSRLRFTYSVGTYTAGEILIEGVDDASVRITANSTDFPAVDVDLDGDDVTDLQPTWSWVDIMQLLVF